MTVSLALASLAAAMLVPAAAAHGEARAAEPNFRPPAVPLVTHSPYFSAWSFADHLTDDWSRHWTGAIQAMCCMVRIDDRAYRLAGPQPSQAPPLKQVGLRVTATASTYTFREHGVEIAMEFLSPLLPHDLDVLGRPVTYVTWTVRSTDGRTHDVALYYDCSAEWAVNTSDQEVEWGRVATPGLVTARFGNPAQPVLHRAGDDLRIDWGWFMVSRPAKLAGHTVIAADRDARDSFVLQGTLPAADDRRMPRKASDDWPVLANTFAVFKSGPRPVSRHLLLAYDEVWSVELMGQRLRPWWRRNGAGEGAMLAASEADYAKVRARCRTFDAALHRDLAAAGGAKYAQLCELAYRQAVASHGLAAGEDGEPLLFPKECFSNGCIATVDVLYPSSPLFLLVSPVLAKAQLRAVLDYAASPRWKWPFAPHDLGTYPLANGQVYGGGERTEEDQMPVEESGNMLIMLAAIAHVEGSAAFSEKYWPQLEKWAAYLKEHGQDPENQLCTDDFAGHLAHNTNLSLKAIEALGAFGQLCGMAGRASESAEYLALARTMAGKWVEMAADGDHYRLTFDRPGTWSQKYNLAWDTILGLNLFPPSVAEEETAWYLGHLNPFGLPLDGRKAYTKLDWAVWTASLATDRATFEQQVAPLYHFANASPSRVPLSDWFETTDGRVVGFQARTVVGGLFIPLLKDPAIWSRWSKPGK